MIARLDTATANPLITLAAPYLSFLEVLKCLTECFRGAPGMARSAN